MCRPVDAMYSICTKQVDHILMADLFKAATIDNIRAYGKRVYYLCCHDMEISYIIYHGSLYRDMNVYHDIDKSDEIITIM